MLKLGDKRLSNWTLDKEIIAKAAVGSDYDTKELERNFGKTRFQKALCGNHDSGIFPHVHGKKVILEVPKTNKSCYYITEIHKILYCHEEKATSPKVHC